MLPCNEIFRIIYAPHRSIALAFTNGPWGKTLTEVVHRKPDRPTKVNADGTWHVSLAGGVGREHAAVLGNLVLGQEGREVANRVWRAILDPSSYMRGLKASGRRSPMSLPGRLRAPIPFDFDVLEIDVQGFKPRADVEAWVGLRIEAFAWPPPPLGPPKVIHWRPWKDTRRGKNQTPIDAPPPYSKLREEVGSQGDTPVDPNVDPSKDSQGRLIQAPGATQRNLPWLKRAPKDISHIYTGPPRKRTSKPVGTLSAGNAVSGLTGAAMAQVSTETPKPGSTRFGEVLAMFDRLYVAKQIQGLSIVQPGPQETENRGAVAAWRMPVPQNTKFRRNPWYKVDTNTVRSAMVCALRLKESDIYWIEIEMKANESGYCSLIFTFLEDSLNSVIAALLRIAVQKRGVWPNSNHLSDEAGVYKAAKWMHSQIGGHLNGKRALSTICKLLPEDEGGEPE